MSKRFEWHSYYKRMVLDTKTNKIIKVIDTLNQQARRIAELEEQLKNAIVPKFKVGQEVFFVYKDDIIESYNISKMSLMCFDDNGDWLKEDELFATKEEAQAKLQELQGE